MQLKHFFRHRRHQLWLLPCIVFVGVVGVLLMRDDRGAEELEPAQTDLLTALTKGLAMEGQIPVESTSWDRVDNPSRDGWDTEALSQQAHGLLDRIGKLAFGDEPLSAAAIESFCDHECTIDRLLPGPLSRIYDDGVVQVARWSQEKRVEAEQGALDSKPSQGSERFAAAAKELAALWSTAKEKRVNFKIFRVERQAQSIETRQYVSVSGQAEDRFIEQHATWVTRWSISSQSENMRLLSLRPVDFEQTTCRGSGRLFSDCTVSVLKDNDCYETQFLFGLNHWLDRNQDMRYFSPLGNPGLAVGDVNGDGLDDLYVCQESHLPNRLFIQQSDGTAREVAANWRVDWLESTRSALLVDLDNDGDQDLVAAILGGLVVASNEGDHFEIQDVLTTHDDTTSVSATDYDLDGDLDLYVCVDYPNDDFGSSSPATDSATVQVGAASRVYHDANTAGKNSLFRNESGGDSWNFRDVTVETGLDHNNRRFSWAAAWEDYDNDGDQDLYVANDFGRNNLYANQNGHFVDIAGRVQAEDSASGMSVAWADVNRDGNMDLYISNMFSSAGSRISHQPQFKQDTSAEVRSRLQRFARGSTLLQNTGQSHFQDVSARAGVTVGRWAWSSNFLDINNDGWQDIAVANGYITSSETGDL